MLSLLEDHRQCQVVLVTIPEETPVNEAVETAFSLEDRVGIGLGPIVVNGVYPPIDGLVADAAAVAAAADEADVSLRPGEAEALAAAARFRLDRTALQAEQVARLAGAAARCRSCACRSCSAPRSAPPSSTSWPGRCSPRSTALAGLPQ